MAGRVTFTGMDSEGRNISRVVVVRDGQIFDNKFCVYGKVQHHIVYGRFENTVTEAGRNVVRFNPEKRSGKGLHGKSRMFTELFDKDGVCHSWYKQGRLMRQKFIYDNQVLAYDWKLGAKETSVKDYYGKPLYHIKGEIDSSRRWAGDTLFDTEMIRWTISRSFEIQKHIPIFGMEVVLSGQYDGQGNRTGKWVEGVDTGEYLNSQRNGKWMLGGKEVFYEHGVAIPKKLHETPPEKLDIKKVLKEPNAQLRMALMAKARHDRNFGRRMAELGNEVHRQGSMRLYDIKGFDTRILRVQCPSTKSLYFIQVPQDSQRCEEARQWTFHKGEGLHINGNIKFAQET
jgi:hypothetical protein